MLQLKKLALAVALLTAIAVPALGDGETHNPPKAPCDPATQTCALRATSPSKDEESKDTGLPADVVISIITLTLRLLG